MYNIGQRLFARCSYNNVSKYSEVVITNQNTPNNFTVNGTDLEDSIIKEYFMTEDEFKQLIKMGIVQVTWKETDVDSYIENYKQFISESELDSLVGKTIKAVGTVNDTTNAGQVQTFIGTVVGYGKEVMVSQGLKGFKYSLHTDEGTKFVVVKDMMWKVLSENDSQEVCNVPS